MSHFRSAVLRLVFSLKIWMMRPFLGLRIMLAKGLILMEDPDHRLEYTLESFAGEMRSAGLVVRHLVVRWGDIWAEVVPHGPVLSEN